MSLVTIYPLELVVTYDRRPGYGRVWVGKVEHGGLTSHVQAYYESREIEIDLHKQLSHSHYGAKMRDRIVPELMRFMDDWVAKYYADGGRLPR